MKTQLARWGLVLCLLLALLPTGASAASGGATELFGWTASANYATNRTAITDNLIFNSAKYYNTHSAAAVTVGGKNYNVHYMSTKWWNNDGDYGLPSETVAADMIKATQALDLYFTAGVNADTTDMAAVNLSFVYAVRPERMDTNVFALDKLKVRVATEGTDWLEGSVGMRSWELIGKTADDVSPAVYLFRIETEDLLSIDGLNSGDIISNVRIQPHGDYYYAWSGTSNTFGLSSLAINGYASADAFNAAVPDGRDDLLTLGEDALRDIVVAHAQKFAQTEWVTDTAIDPGFGASYAAGVKYRGPMYNQGVDSGYEVWREYIDANGKYTGETTGAGISGMDCISFAYDAYSRVSRSHSWILYQTQSDNSLQLLGGLQSDESPTYTDVDIIDLNTAEDILAAYAQVKKGDLVITYSTMGNEHIRIARDAAVVVYEADGVTIDPDKSYIPCIEQGSTTHYYYRTAGGEIVRITADDLTKNTKTYIDRYASSNGYTFLYGTSVPELDYSFSQLLDGNYAPMTLKEYQTGAVENVEMQSAVVPTAGTEVAEGFTAVAAADYHVDRMRVALTEMDGTVLYEDEMISNGSASGRPRQYNHCWTYTSSAGMNAAMENLGVGEYRIAVSMLAGPVATSGADREEVTEYHTFSTGHVHDCAHGHDVTDEWTNLNSLKYAEGSNLALTAGNYYLTEDYTGTASLVTPADASGIINICLNGHTISGENMTNAYVIRTGNTNTCTVNICDCTGEGKIANLNNTAYGATSCAVILARGGATVNLYGGTITDNTATAIVSAISNFNMYGGTITGNQGAEMVYIHDSGIFGLKDGLIVGNTTTTNGVVHGNKSSSQFGMTGGTISDNVVPEGKELVTGTTRTGEGGVLSAIHACTDHESIAGWKPLSRALEGFTVQANNTLMPAGKYYLDKDITLTAEQKYLYINGDVELCLNGYTLSAQEGSAYIISFSGAHTLNLYDCSARQSGRIGGNVAVNNGVWNSSGGSTNAAIIVRAGATFNMYGGAITGVGGKQAVYVASGNTFNLYGGVISDNPVTGNQVQGTVNNMGGAVSSHNHKCDHGHVDATADWKSFNALVGGLTPNSNKYLNLYAASSGCYYLTEDLDLGVNSIQLNSGIDITVCLNGYTIKTTNAIGFRYNAQSVLTICDCSAGETGKVQLTSRASGKQTTTGSVLARSGGTFNLYGGTLVGGVTCVSTTVNIYGGKIQALSDGEVLYVHNTAASNVNVQGGEFVGYNGAEPKLTHKGTGSVSLYEGTALKTAGTYQLVANSGTGLYFLTTHAHTCAAHKDIADWQPLSGKLSASSTTSLTGGHYYLDKDITLGQTAATSGTYYLEVTGNSVLCLNGFTLNGQYCKDYIFRANGATLDICDCSKAQTGTITGMNVDISGSTSGVGIARGAGACINIYGGNFNNNTAGRLFYVAAGCNLNIYDADIDLGGSKLLATRANSATSVVALSGGTYSGGVPINTILAYLAQDDAYRVSGTAAQGYEVVRGLDCSGAVIDFGSSLNVSLPLVGDNGVELTDDYTVTLSTDKYTAAVGDLVLEPGVSRAVVVIEGIAAKEMRDEFTVTVTKDGVEYYKDTLSVYELAERWYNGAEDGTYKTMLADMLNYGAEAHKTFLGNEVADERLPGTQTDPQWSAVGSIPEAYRNKVAFTLSLKDKIELNVYIDDANADISGVTFKDAAYDKYTVSHPTDTNGKAITLVKFGQIDVVDAAKAIHFAVELSGGESFEMSCGIPDYVVRALANTNNAQSAVIRALQKYVDSVSAYIGANS